MPEPIIISDPVDLSGQTEKPRTISRTGSLLKGAAAMAAGVAVNEFIKMPLETGDTAFPADVTASGTADEATVAESTILADSASSYETSSWNPASAPAVSGGTVNDDMSFEEAFAAAREEVGAGGIFVWHGEAYNTFYAEEIGTTDQYQANPQDDNNNFESGSLYAETSETGTEAEIIEAGYTEEGEFQNPSYGPAIIAADLNADGNADAIAVDLNYDGSADMLSTDLNSDGVLAEDEVIIIHDPESLVIPETPSDGSVISVDVNDDGMDDILLGDVNNDQMADFIGADENRDQEIDQAEIQVLNPEAMEGLTGQPETIEYSGEVASDVPEDVTAGVLDQMEGDLSALEDNFEEINDWS